PVPAMLEVSLRPAPLDPGERAYLRDATHAVARAAAASPFAEAGHVAANMARLALEGARALELAVVAAAEAEAVPTPLLAEGARVLGGVAGAATAPVAAEVRTGGLTFSGPSRPPLADRYAPSEAARHFRLPIPAATGVAGLRTTRRAFET